MHRSWGGVVAGVLFVVPSLFILIGLSWVYIAAGGPLVESTHGDLKFTAPLTAITAAVALLRYKANVIHVIAGCALAGLVVRLLVGV